MYIVYLPCSISFALGFGTTMIEYLLLIIYLVQWTQRGYRFGNTYANMGFSIQPE